MEGFCGKGGGGTDTSYFWKTAEELSAVNGVPIFSATHLSWLACVLLGAVLAVRFFVKSTAAVRKRMLLCCVWTGVGSELLRDVWLLASGRFVPSYMLPLHLCGVMLFIELWAVLREGPLARELCYCAGLPGALGALLTPGETGYPFWNLMYWQFILAHAMLFLTPVLLLCSGFRPNPRRLPACFAALTAFACIAAVANAAFGGNYMFLREAPPGSVLELLAQVTGGFYQVGMAVLVLVFWAVLYLPWRRILPLSRVDY